MKLSVEDLWFWQDNLNFDDDEEDLIESVES